MNKDEYLNSEVVVVNMGKQMNQNKESAKVYNGCGNSFVIRMYEKKFDNALSAKWHCEKRYDGFILVKPYPLEMIIYNQDGSLAAMCGNGIRCFIQYCYDHHILQHRINAVITKSGIVQTEIISTEPFMVKVIMNEAKYCFHDKYYFAYPIVVNQHKYEINLIHTGVWHNVILPVHFDECLADIQEIYYLPFFHQEVNIDIVQLKHNAIYVKTYERGVGFTKACGTGVVAVYLVLKQLGKLCCDDIEIQTDGGTLRVGMHEFHPVLIGPSIAEKRNETHRG